jgi:hypothetical protein
MFLLVVLAVVTGLAQSVMQATIHVRTSLDMTPTRPNAD